MARKVMTFVPLDIEFFDNARILAAGEKPTFLLLNMFCRTKRLKSDGVLSELQIERLHVPGWRKRLDILIEVGLVLLLDDGKYLIVGWLERNMSSQEIADFHRKDSARKAAAKAAAEAKDSARIPDGSQTESALEVEVELEEEKEVERVVGLRSVGGVVHSLGTTA